MNLQGGPLDMAVALAAGIAVSFTPCVYPVLPVTAAAVAGANTRGRRIDGFLLAGMYVLGMAVTYSGFAVAAALAGRMFGVWQNNPWTLVAAGNIVLLFGLVLLDVIPFPSLQVVPAGGRPRSRGALFVMGLVAGLLVGPCTAPVLGTLLLYVASRQNVLWGAWLMFLFALGLGTSVLFAGTFGGVLAAMPRAGVWMLWVRRAAAWALLVLAEFLFLRAGGLV